jgi:hypothetical protein
VPAAANGLISYVGNNEAELQTKDGREHAAILRPRPETAPEKIGDETNNMAMRYSSGNKSTIERGWTYPILILGLEYAAKLRESGMVQNFYTWELKHRIEAYYLGRNELYAGPNGIPYEQIDLWSEKALESYSRKKEDARNLVREHGAPRTPFSAMVLDLYMSGNLSEKVMNDILDLHYKLAVITKEEDKQLNAIRARSKLYPSPEERWAAASINIISKKKLETVNNV